MILNNNLMFANVYDIMFRLYAEKGGKVVHTQSLGLFRK